ncbi:MAG TPA: AI-2E family transporter, partial [Chitinophagaceae bacterium]|nr:AI-2E family transporter [Chitinophagaceae bacterium]
TSAIHKTQVMVKNYLIGLFFQMVIVSVLFIIAYSIIGVKYAILLAIMTGLLNIIPYVGIIFSMLLAMLIAFATGSPAQVAFIVIAVLIINAIDGNIVMPKIIGSKVKVNSLAVIIGMVIGEKVWGIMGMLLTIPILAMTKIIFDHIKELKPWGFLLGEDNTVIDNMDTSVIKSYFNTNIEETISLKDDLKSTPSEDDSVISKKDDIIEEN